MHPNETDQPIGFIDKESLIVGLHDLGLVRFGKFKLKTGKTALVRLNFGPLVSRPATLRRIAHVMQAYAAQFPFDQLAAIPDASLPMGIAVSLTMDRPLVYPRRVGTEYHVEGAYRRGETVLLVGGLITRSEEVLSIISLLKSRRLKIKHVLALIDLQTRGEDVLSRQGIVLQSVLTLPEILDTLLSVGRISKRRHRSVTAWLEESLPDTA